MEKVQAADRKASGGEGQKWEQDEREDKKIENDKEPEGDTRERE